ncbi:MAG TPA: DNA polymerase III subunit [Vicinamibacteria bacterium]|nr:DNA polymerase III subunit [Vicinamibacteria bacterium]
MPFPDVLGHDRVKGLLARALGLGRLPPALLLTGPEGVGKRTLALEVARGLVCDAGPGEPCGRCRTCLRSARSLHPDLIVVAPEKSENFMKVSAIKIDQVRDAVREIAGLPFEARARAVIIDDAHAMTEQAMNALLKSLEEPPATSHVMLVTASPQALLPTIRSRSQTLRLGPLPSVLLESHLQDRLGLTPAEARLRAALSGGSLGAALAFEAEGYRALRDAILIVLEKAPGSAAHHRLQWSEGLADAEDPLLVLTALRSLLRDVAAARAGVPPDRLLNADVGDRVQGVARGPLGERALALSEAAEEVRTNLRGNASRPLSMDVLVDTLAG